MNLLEVVNMYRDFLCREGRAAAENFLHEVGAEDLSRHISPCFDENGVVLGGIDSEPAEFMFVN